MASYPRTSSMPYIAAMLGWKVYRIAANRVGSPLGIGSSNFRGGENGARGKAGRTGGEAAGPPEPPLCGEEHEQRRERNRAGQTPRQTHQDERRNHRQDLQQDSPAQVSGAHPELLEPRRAERGGENDSQRGEKRPGCEQGAS